MDTMDSNTPWSPQLDSPSNLRVRWITAKHSRLVSADTIRVFREWWSTTGQHQLHHDDTVFRRIDAFVSNEELWGAYPQDASVADIRAWEIRMTERINTACAWFVGAKLLLDALDQRDPIVVPRTEFGAPDVARLRPGLSISLSHDSSSTACLTTHVMFTADDATPFTGVGLDIVRVVHLSVEDANLYRLSFTEREFALVSEADSPSDRGKRAAYLWGLKEAVLKALGVGLASPEYSLKDVDLGYTSDGGKDWEVFSPPRYLNGPQIVVPLKSSIAAINAIRCRIHWAAICTTPLGESEPMVLCVAVLQPSCLDIQLLVDMSNTVITMDGTLSAYP